MESSDYKITDWLPTTKEEVVKRGWDELDVIIVTGDAYIDHPSFGSAVIGRIIESKGFKVAILPQPNCKDDLRDFKKLGRPKYFFGVTSGCLDSMLNNYTSSKRKRNDDDYSPAGLSGFRPDNATVVYTKILKELYPETPVIIGGVEASLRRLTYYDYWTDSLKPSILWESGADLLVYGMGEQPLLAILNEIINGKSIAEIKNISQTAYITKQKAESEKFVELHSHEECLNNKLKFAENFVLTEKEYCKINQKGFIQKIDDKFLVVNPNFPPLDEKQADYPYELKYTRLPHPKYKKRGNIPAYEMIKHSVNIHRGCFGGCSFCSIVAHQGKFISSRSENSILNEINQISKLDDFKGYLSDLGGPSANMYKMKGSDLNICNNCKRFSCIYPQTCHNLNANHKPLINLYEKVNSLTFIKKATIGSGLRYDIFIGKSADEDKKNHYSEYFKLLVSKHVSGRLKIAPEHTVTKVLNIMRKPAFNIFFELKTRFNNISRGAGLNQEIATYFISGHPGCTVENMAELAVETKKAQLKLEQVQDFTPLPMTLSSVIYYTGIDPYSLKEIYSAKHHGEKEDQKMFFFWYRPENKSKIIRILNIIKRVDLITKLFK